MVQVCSLLYGEEADRKICRDGKVLVFFKGQTE